VIDLSLDPFALFGLPRRYALDAAALGESYRALQRDVHPDRHVAGDERSQRLALQASARVNEAYRTLASPVERARCLLELAGVDALAETDTALPIDFLERQLERREDAARAAAHGDLEALDRLAGEARAEAAALEADLRDALDVRGDAAAAKPRVRELAFLDKLGRDLDVMLDQAAA
jgi:molecular chaperone HscB